jgi:hypothetical protein
MASAKAPWSRLSTDATACCGVSPASTFSETRCATTSVSVWLVKTRPRAISSSRSDLKFSMMPLWTKATSPVACGWALSSVGAPCVAQRVWAMPVWPGSGFCGENLRQIVELARRAAAIDHAVMIGGDARRIIAAIFEPPQAVEQPPAHIFLTDDTDDAAHSLRPLSKMPTPPSACIAC